MKKNITRRSFLFNVNIKRYLFFLIIFTLILYFFISFHFQLSSTFIYINDPDVIHYKPDILTCTNFYTNKTVLIKPEELEMERTKGIKFFTNYNCKPKYYNKDIITKWNENDTIVFHHYQKTSGTAFVNHMIKHCCNENNLFCKFFNARSSEPKQCNGITFGEVCHKFFFHSPIAAIQECFGNDAKLISLIRNPIARIRSEYGHMARMFSEETSNRWMHDKSIFSAIMNKSMSVDDFVKYPRNPAINRQSEIFLLSIFNNSNTVNIHDVRNNWNEYFNLSEEDIANHLSKNKYQYLELIKDMVDYHFLWIGTVELYCESFAIFNYIFDSNIQPIIYKYKEIDISEDAIKIIEERGQLELLFYQYITEKINNQYNYLLSINYPLANCER